MKIYLIFCFIIFTATILNVLADRFLKRRWILWISFGLPAFVMLLFMWNVSDPPNLLSDFGDGYYPAAQTILNNPDNLYEKDCGKDLLCGFVYMPILAYLFAPFTLFDLFTAKIIMIVLSVLSVLLTLYIIFKMVDLSYQYKMIICSLFIINGPLYNSIKEGNVTHFVLLLLTAALYSISKKREVWAGIFLAIAGLLKIPLFLLGVYFLLRRQWYVIVGYGLALIVIVGTSILIFGPDLHLAWYESAIKPLSNKTIGAFNVQSLDSLLIRLTTERSLLDWNPIQINPETKLLRYAILALLFIASAYVFKRSAPECSMETRSLEFSIVICLTLIASPISWTHYYLYLLLPISLFVSGKIAVFNNRIWLALLVASTFLVSLPVGYYRMPYAILRMLRDDVLSSHYFFGGLLLFTMLLAARWRLSTQDQKDLVRCKM